ncbi:MAG: DsbA family oxidoreductase [Solibacillus sp.]
MNIEIFSDFACPFCYIAKTRLYEAIEQLGMSDEVTITYKAYQLKPDASKIDSPKIVLKQDVQNAIAEHAKEVGVTFNFDKLVAGNSENAHRLTKWAEMYRKGKAFFDELIQYYFEAGVDLNREADLLVIVEKLNLPVEEARSVLRSDAFSEELVADRYDAQQLQVTRVPFFVFNNKYGIIGVEPIEVFLKTLQQAK